MTTLTIAQVNEGIVYQKNDVIVTWTPGRGDHLGDGVQITAVMIICTPGDDNMMVGFDAADSDELQAMIDRFWK